MRRLFIAATLCAAFLVTGVASAAPVHTRGPARPAVHSAVARAVAEQVPFRFAPLGRRLSGTGTISLNVYQYSGLAEAGAATAWWVTEGTDVGHGTGTTAADGSVTMTGVPAANGNGEIAVVSDDQLTLYDLWGMSWSSGGYGPAGLQPGRLGIVIMTGEDSNWNTWDYARVRLFTSSGTEVNLARTDIAKDGSQTNAYAPTITRSSSETLSGGSIYFWDDEGMELPVNGITVSPGATKTLPSSIWEDSAQRVWMDYWGSGKPGTSTWLVLNDYPAGWVNSIGGAADYPSSARDKSFGTLSTTGAQYDVKKIVIPSSAAVGYSYWVWADHTDGTLSLVTSFQTCTLKPSKASVAKNTAITLSGVVPVKGHYGAKKGTPKYVTIYKTTSAKLAGKGQPPVYGGGSRASGWTKVGKVRTDGLGKYRKGSVRPARTTWYVAWYPGDSWYWGAWTSVAKVTAK